MEFGVDLDQTAVDLLRDEMHGLFVRIHVTFFTGIRDNIENILTNGCIVEGLREPEFGFIYSRAR